MTPELIAVVLGLVVAVLGIVTGWLAARRLTARPPAAVVTAAAWAADQAVKDAPLGDDHVAMLLAVCAACSLHGLTPDEMTDVLLDVVPAHRESVLANAAALYDSWAMRGKPVSPAFE